MMMNVPGYYAQRGAFGWVNLHIIACGLLLPAFEQILKIPLWNMAAVGLAANSHGYVSLDGATVL